MNRAQMIEKAARAHALWYDGSYSLHRDAAIYLLDAILPQVTTVAELEALPHRSGLVVNRNGAAAHKMRGWADEGGGIFFAISGTNGVRWDADTLLKYAGDEGLTVVWQPEVTR